MSLSVCINRDRLAILYASTSERFPPLVFVVSLTFICVYLQVRTANLLGVVGTDVPIQQIQKLVQPYKVRVQIYNKKYFHKK